MTHELNQRLTGLVIAWIVLTPFLLLSVALLAWGRASLSRAAVTKGLVRTGAATLVAFPAAWGVLALCARFNPAPVVGPAEQGLWWAAMFLPAYSTLVACAAFEFVLQEALKNGARPRARWVRGAAELTLALVVLGDIGILVAGCFLAAGPKALG